jgi:hypothetical protein
MKWAALLLLLPSPAWACPACALRESGGPATLGLVAGMIAVPYAVAVVALKIIRRLDR